jgi:hypothetical protein
VISIRTTPINAPKIPKKKERFDSFDCASKYTSVPTIRDVTMIKIFKLSKFKNNKYPYFH